VKPGALKDRILNQRAGEAFGGEDAMVSWKKVAIGLAFYFALVLLVS